MDHGPPLSQRGAFQWTIFWAVVGAPDDQGGLWWSPVHAEMVTISPTGPTRVPGELPGPITIVTRFAWIIVLHESNTSFFKYAARASRSALHRHSILVALDDPAPKIASFQQRPRLSKRGASADRAGDRAIGLHPH